MADLTGKSLYEVFSLAIEGEQQAQELYTIAARLAGEESDIGRMFLAMAIDEQRHEKDLMREYAIFKKILKEQEAAAAKADGPGPR